MILSNLVWLFPAHREAIDEITRLKLVVAALEFELQHQAAASVSQLMLDYQEKVLTDQPFPEGKIPDNYWLSPVTERIA